MEAGSKVGGKRAIRGRTRAKRLGAISKGAWALFVSLQVTAAGLLFLIFFYVFLAFIGGVFGAQFGLKEWRPLVGQWSGPAAWLLVGFLMARLGGQVSLDLMERFRKVRCPDCGTELAPNDEVLDRDALLFCPQCGAKL